MRIIYASIMRLPTEKAHGYQAMKMCAAFAGEGHDVTLAVPDRPDSGMEDPFSFYGIPPSFAIVRLPVFCPFVTDPAFSIFYPALVMTFAVSLVRFLRRFPTADSCAYVRDIDLGWIISRFSAVPVSYEMHSVSRMTRILSGAFLRFRSVICLTSRLRAVALSSGVDPSRAIVASDAADPGDFLHAPDRAVARTALDIPHSAEVVAYVGRFTTMDHDKGVKDLIRAYASAAGPNSLLLLVGADPFEMRPYAAFVRERGVADSVRIVPFRPHRLISAYLRAADILVMPFPRTDHYSFHMSPLKMFEYMASGTPILTTDLPAIREILDERSAVFVPPDDALALADGIRAVFADIPGARARAARAFSLAASHTWISRARHVVAHVSRP